VKKIFNQSGRSVKVFDYTLDAFKIDKILPKTTQISADWALFLQMKQIYLEHFKGTSEKYDGLMTTDILGNKNYMKTISLLLK
jgi:hypothetical protein